MQIKGKARAGRLKYSSIPDIEHRIEADMGSYGKYEYGSVRRTPWNEIVRRWRYIINPVNHFNYLHEGIVDISCFKSIIRALVLIGDILKEKRSGKKKK